MKIIKFDNDEEGKKEWMDYRIGKIGGSGLKDIITEKGEKKAFYQLIADRLAIPKDEEDVRDRGNRLEVEAIEELEKKINKVFIKDRHIWQREDNESIMVSPDGYLEDEKEAVEVKCLNSAEHIEALITEEYPKQYRYQALQYFIVNDKLEKLYFVMYEPRLRVSQFIYFEIYRANLEGDIAKYLQYEKDKLEKVNYYVEKLSF